MQNPSPGAARSTFVNVVAWIYIVWSGFGTFVAGMQNILLHTLFPIEQMQSAISTMPASAPPFVASIFENIRLIVFAFFVLELATLVASVGLLRRRNWARLLFIALLALNIVWNIIGIVLQQWAIASMLDWTTHIPNGAPPDFDVQMQSMMTSMRVFSALFAIGFSVLFAWIIQRLMSPAIAREFH